jgi:hypothetical protein
MWFSSKYDKLGLVGHKSRCFKNTNYYREHGYACCVVLWSIYYVFSVARQPYSGPNRLTVEVLRSQILSHNTLGRTSLDEWSARRRDFYLITYSQETLMTPEGFESTIPVSQRPKTHFLDRTATGIGPCFVRTMKFRRLRWVRHVTCVGYIRGNTQL